MAEVQNGGECFHSHQRGLSRHRHSALAGVRCAVGLRSAIRDYKDARSRSRERTSRVQDACDNQAGGLMGAITYVATAVTDEDLIQRANNDQQLDEALGKIITPSRGPLRDSEISRIREVLELHGKARWSLIPRHFFVLKKIGCVGLIDHFIDQGLSDYYFPYSEGNIPDIVKGTVLRNQFLESQQLVLTPKIKALETRGGIHQSFANTHSLDELYTTTKELGGGTFGQVDCVWSHLSLTYLARKRIGRGPSFKRDVTAIRSFENELRSLKRLSHHHLVEILGSYTDPLYVAFFLRPVAEMNLEKYLTYDADPEDKRICLRRFYGCLANAVRYLHDNRVRHKDIKPSNILVKNRNVFLTDFGTSRSWDDDEKDTTSGTSVQFTRRYCAPEVSDHGERNAASDIWSLGCVFLEMSAVLNHSTLMEMKKFYAATGTKKPYVRTNLEATQAWIEQLHARAICEDDLVPMDWIQEMIQFIPGERKTARQLVNLIFEYEGEQRYYGVCCYDDYANIHPSPLDILDGSADSLEPGCELTNGGEPDPNTEALPPPYTPRLLEDEPALSPAPVENHDQFHDQLPEDLLVAAPEPGHDSSPEESYVTTPTTTDDVLSLAVIRIQQPFPSHPVPEKPPQMLDLTPYYTTVEDATYDGTVIVANPDAPDLFGTAAPLIECAGEKALPEHRRERDVPVQTPAPAGDSSHTSSIDTPSFTCESPDCASTWPKHSTFDTLEALHLHYRDLHSVHESSHSKLIDTEHSSESLQAVHISKVEGNSEPTIKSALASGQKASSKKNVRFEVTSATDHEVSTSPSSIETGRVLPEFKYVPPQPLLTPGRYQNDAPLPMATSAPSYIMACRNRLPRTEFASYLPTDNMMARASRTAVFLYGGSMFPHVLSAQAAYLMESRYSQLYQRRLSPSAADFCSVHTSSAIAAQRMSPAILKGFERWRPRGSSHGAIRSTTEEVIHVNVRPLSRHALDPASEVDGLVLLGLSQEAIRCLDNLYCEMPLEQEKKAASNIKAPQPRRQLRKEEVIVTVTTDEDEEIEIRAVTFVWAARRREKREYAFNRAQGLIRSPPPWNPNRFLTSSWHKGIANSSISKRLQADERKIARELGMLYTLPGDELCNSVLHDDLPKVTEMLNRHDYDVNAPCSVHDCALNAAIRRGNTDMVKTLLDWDADSSGIDSDYGSPIMAATVLGHTSIVECLVSYGASVSTSDPDLISPLYQAISYSNEKMVLTLLERGAWLTSAYDELLDLGEEKGNRSIKRLLLEYDVRDVHRDLEKLRGEEEGDSLALSSSSQEGENSLDDPNMSAGAVLRVVAAQILINKGRPGLWTGMKGVHVLKAALEAGAPLSILRYAEKNLSSGRKLLDYLTAASAQLRLSTTFRSDSQNRKLDGEVVARDIARELPSPRVQSMVENASKSPVSGSSFTIECRSCKGSGVRSKRGRTCVVCGGQGQVSI